MEIKIQKNENKKFSFMDLMINFLDIFFEFIVIERNKYITQSIQSTRNFKF